MRIVFSRKGFDSKFGGGASPIIDGRPMSLPIPAGNGEQTTYAGRGLSEEVMHASRGRISGADCCHDDPMFANGHCWLGQCKAAQGHLRNQGVGPGDVFVFFGLFAQPETGERHHRIFGYMRVLSTGSPQAIVRDARWREPPRAHPHFSGEWHHTNAIWFGEGCVAERASDALRLTAMDPTAGGGKGWSRWNVPQWLMENRPSYLKGDWRMIDERTLDVRGIWQEGVCDIGNAREPRRWLDEIIAQIES